MINKLPRDRRYFFMGFLGFLGFGGFQYFQHHQPGSLFIFCFFSYFSYFLLARLAREIPDERLVENARKAREKAFLIPFFALFAVGFSTSYAFCTMEYVALVSAIGWAGAILAYPLLLFHYEKN